MADPIGVSFVVPYYNDAQHLPSVLRSIAADDYTPRDVVVVDDGSIEDPCPILRGFPDVRLVRHPVNRGVAEALNTGLEHARYDLVCWVSSDDGILPGKTSAQVAAMAATGAVLCFTAYEERTEDGVAVCRIGLRAGRVVTPVFGPRYRDTGRWRVIADADAWLLHKNLVNGSTVMMQGSAVRGAGGFNAKHRYAQDYEMWLRLAQVGAVVYVDRVFGWRTQHARQMSRDAGGSPLLADHWSVVEGLATPARVRRMFRHLGVRRSWTWLAVMPRDLRVRMARCAPFSVGMLLRWRWLSGVGRVLVRTWERVVYWRQSPAGWVGSMSPGTRAGL